MSVYWQIKKIHALKTFLGISDENYRKMLQSFQVCSSKNLTETEANILISTLEERANEFTQRIKKYDELLGRDEKMATPSQLRKLEAVWADIKRLRTKNKHVTLRQYLKKHFKVYSIKFLTKDRAREIIAVLEKRVLKRLEECILEAI